MKRLRLGLAIVLLAAAILACGAPTVSQPQANQVATVVAQTMSAVTPFASPNPQKTSDILPRSLYFLNNDKGGLIQVYRLDRDGKTLHQVTFEPVNVGSFDVSPVNGSVAYISNNQFLWVDMNGVGRRVIMDGGPINTSGPLSSNNSLSNTVSSPVWSPDGKTIAFGHDGLNLYSVGDGSIQNVLKNDFDLSHGAPVVNAIYAPVKYSPDGSKLVVSIGFIESGTMGVYSIASRSVTRLMRPDGGLFCCNIAWTPDGSGIYGANPTTGMVESGLLYANASSGVVNILLPNTDPSGNYNFADAPQIGPDGKLHFFFNNLKDPIDRLTPLYMVKSESDGVTGRTQVRPDVFQNVNQILWAPDTSFAILAYAPTQDVLSGGQAVIEYADGRPSVVLADFALDLKWGP